MGKKQFWTKEELIKLPKTIGEAISQNDRFFYTGKPCRKEHFFPRHSDSGKCVECRRESIRKTQAKSREKENCPKSESNTSLYKIGLTTHGLSRSIEMKLFNTAKRRSKKKGIQFTIKVTDILIPDFCPLLNIPISKMWGNVTENNFNRFNKPSLDRIDPRIGYTPENIIVMSYRANMIKGDGFPDEHRKIADFLIKYKL
jgi:hypothetical protein